MGSLYKEKLKIEIDKWDPIGLFNPSIAAPKDEYDMEVEGIFQQLAAHEKLDWIVVGKAIFAVFADSFGNSFDRKFNENDCYEIARKILEE